LTDDIESFKAVMTAVNKQIKGELSDDELDNVAGGITEDFCMNMVAASAAAGATIGVVGLAAIAAT
ncbi:MAG: hypothetical protein ACI4KM_02580, partial [Oscillospiraceae bacterium]